MAKYCPKCGKENMDSAGFCESCGEELPKSASVSSASDLPPSSKPKGGWWSRQSSGAKIAMIVVGICCVGLVAVVGLAGVFFPEAVNSSFTTSWDTPELTQTFSQAGLTFNYPSGWTNGTAPVVVSGGSQTKTLGILESSDGLILAIQKVDLVQGETVVQMKDATKQGIISGSSAQILGDNKTSINGVTVYEYVFTFKDPASSTDGKSVYMVTGKDASAVYYMQFVGETGVIDRNMELIHRIINTIKIQ